MQKRRPSVVQRARAACDSERLRGPWRRPQAWARVIPRAADPGAFPGLDKPMPRRYNSKRKRGDGSTSYHKREGVAAMSILEVLGLLNLLAVVIFGVINATKNK